MVGMVKSFASPVYFICFPTPLSTESSPKPEGVNNETLHIRDGDAGLRDCLLRVSSQIHKRLLSLLLIKEYHDVRLLL